MNPVTRGQRIADGFSGLVEGMDAATPPDAEAMRLRTALAVNCSHRGGYITHRPGFIRRDLTFSNEQEEQAFHGSVFQGATVYYPDTEYPRIVLSVGGHLYEIRPSENYAVSDVSIPGDIDNSFLTRCWFVQAEKWLIKQNGIDKPLIFDGSVSRRPAANEIKPGTCGIYAWGRIWYALPDGRQYRATDIVYGNGNRSDVLKETECDYLQGANFVVPASCGRITAIVVPGMLDNATGQGPVHVFTETAVFSCNAPLDRDIWLDLTNPIQTISQNQHGALSDWSCVVVNGDIFMRAIDGVRSYAIARRNFGAWANTPISREIETFIGNDNRDLLANSSGGLWDNRLLMTCAPYYVRGQGILHKGLVVMDFEPIASMRQVHEPIWDGLWTGLNIHQIVTCSYHGEQRCFLIARSSQGKIEVWELRREALADNNEKPIEWLFASRQLNFSMPYVLKRLDRGVMWVDKLSGTVEFNVSYRADDYPFVSDWASWSECAETETCPVVGGSECIELRLRPPQYRSRIELPMPPESCNRTNNQVSTCAYKFQPIVAVRGSCRVKSFIAIAATEADIVGPTCGQQPCVTVEGCDIDPFSYQVES